jgi:tripartite-type tricarboxylate transporter receptor subunit TctC
MTCKYAVSAIAFIAAGSMLQATSSRAQSAAEFFAGKTVSIYVATGEGGAYTLYAQLAAEHLRRFLPGNPTMIVQNLPGAGGIRTTDYLQNVAPKDGTAIAMLLDLAAVTQMLRPRTVKYDVAKFEVIGSVVTDNPVVMVRADTGVRSFQDLKTKQVIAGASGNGSQTYIHPALMKEVLGANIKIVTGYRGSADISLALERGEVQAQSATWISWKARKADWIKDRKIIPIAQVGLAKEPELPDVPLMSELATSDDDRQVLEFMSSGSQVGRFLAAPPGVPADRVAALRRAFEAMVADTEFLQAAAKQKLEVKATPGPQVQAIIRKVVSYSPAIIQRARDAIGAVD